MVSYPSRNLRGHRAAAHGGKLIVSVTVSENKIESVKVTQHKEYRGIAWGLNTTPMERFPKLIVEYQTLNIPTVDGADLTCAAILDATGGGAQGRRCVQGGHCRAQGRASPEGAGVFRRSAHGRRGRVRRGRRRSGRSH